MPGPFRVWGVGRVCADAREILAELVSEPPLGGSITTRWRGRRIMPGALLYPLRDPGSGTPSGPVTVRPLTHEDIERIEAALAAKGMQLTFAPTGRAGEAGRSPGLGLIGDGDPPPEARSSRTSSPPYREPGATCSGLSF